MTGDNQQSATNESARPRRKSNEKAIKDFVVIIGSLMMIMCFGMLLEVNIRGWNETGQRNSTIVMFVLLCLVVVLFSFYIHWRLKEVCSHLDEELSVAESNNDEEQSRLDRPPDYAKVMGTPPPSYHSLKIPQGMVAEVKIEDEFLSTHI